ncbi:MAG: sugar phosphate isomerase/epimerase family protein [Fuerstiella sp.]
MPSENGSRSRRQFLQTLGTSTVAAVATSGHFSSQAIAADPPVRVAAASFKLSLAAYSFNKQMARRGTKEAIAKAEMSIEKFVEYCTTQGLQAAELTGYYFPKQVTAEYLANLRQSTHRLGVSISGTAIGNDFCLAEGDARKQQLADCRKWVDYAAAMGAPVIRIFAGKVPKGDTEQAAVARCVKGINESVEYAATKGVILALENHGGITATPDQMLGIIKQVDDSPFFGVNFDSGNFATADPYADLARIAPYAVNAQIKVMMRKADRSKYPADLERVIDLLIEAKYRGFVTLEYEELKPFEEIPEYLQQLRNLIG